MEDEENCSVTDWNRPQTELQDWKVDQFIMIQPDECRDLSFGQWSFILPM